MQIYQTAIRCAINEDLRRSGEVPGGDSASVRIVTVSALGFDPDVETPGRAVVRFKGHSLVQSMEMALADAKPAAAQLVAAEAVVEAETKDHANWELMGKVAEKATGKMASVLLDAYEQVEEEEDQHLYHTMGWARELWIEFLGLPAVLPPPRSRKRSPRPLGPHGPSRPETRWRARSPRIRATSSPDKSHRVPGNIGRCALTG